MMKFRVWIANDMNAMCSNDPMDDCVLLRNVSQEDLDLFLKSMARVGFALGIMPELPEDDDNAE